jgi:hypothetical protein
MRKDREQTWGETVYRHEERQRTDIRRDREQPLGETENRH